MSRADQLAERKALLIAEADLYRMQALLAWHEARGIVSPPAPAERSARSRTVAATLIGLMLPFMGGGRLRRLMRNATLALTALRVFRAWRAGGER
jgi:hypothetical protein